jgi:type IV secretory pathway VirB2 component (pilin)
MHKLRTLFGAALLSLAAAAHAAPAAVPVAAAAAPSGLSGLGIRSDQLLQESRALVTGNITEDAAAARILGITKQAIRYIGGKGK